MSTTRHERACDTVADIRVRLQQIADAYPASSEVARIAGNIQEDTYGLQQAIHDQEDG